MRAIRAHFDGRQIVLPPELSPTLPGDVIIIFDDANKDALKQAQSDWHKAQELAFGKVWNNSDDEVYDQL